MKSQKTNEKDCTFITGMLDLFYANKHAHDRLRAQDERKAAERKETDHENRDQQ